MLKRVMLKRVMGIVAAAGLLAACASTPDVPDATYYLVRHAEKILGVPDPALTDAGAQRAEYLAVRLKDVDLTQIYSTDYIRTQETAKPTAAQHGLTVTSYDPKNLEGFAQTLLLLNGHILVVGHSNTTPQLAGYLGSKPGEPIVEATEYDRFYVITRNGKKIEGRTERFGQPSVITGTP